MSERQDQAINSEGGPRAEGRVWKEGQGRGPRAGGSGLWPVVRARELHRARVTLGRWGLKAATQAPNKELLGTL